MILEILEMMAWYDWCLLQLVCALILGLYLNRMIGTMARESVGTFEIAFPGECMVCSYHRYGLQEGHIHGPVKAHSCTNPSKE